MIIELEEIENFNTIWFKIMCGDCCVLTTDCCARNIGDHFDNIKDHKFVSDLIKHSFQVANCASMIAEKMNLPTEKMSLLIAASLLHDNGKYTISKEILNKRGRPTEDESRMMETHPVAGAERIRGVASPTSTFWQEVALIVEQHHEDYDSSNYPKETDRRKGYPGKVSGKAIHHLASIISVADWYISLREPRAYKDGKDYATALKYTLEVVGARLHPHAFLTLSNFSKFDKVDEIDKIRSSAQLLFNPHISIEF